MSWLCWLGLHNWHTKAWRRVCRRCSKAQVRGPASRWKDYNVLATDPIYDLTPIINEAGEISTVAREHAISQAYIYLTAKSAAGERSTETHSESGDKSTP